MRLPKVLDFRLMGLRRFAVEHKKRLAVMAGLFFVSEALGIWCESIGHGGLGVWGLDLIGRFLYVAVLAIMLSFLLGRRLVVLCAVLGFITVLCNGIVMGVNGGYMPTIAGIRELPVGQYILATDATHLNWLGDWIPGSIFGNKFAASPGDMAAVTLFMVVLLELAKRSTMRLYEFIRRRRTRHEISKVA